jgi:hypothetical protein
MGICIFDGVAFQKGVKIELTFPIRLLGTKDLQDVDAATSVRGLQDHVRVNADFFADSAKRVSVF